MKYLLAFLLFFSCYQTSAQADYKTQNTVSAKILSWYDAAFRESATGNFKEAERYLESALKKEPTFLDARVLRANINYEKGNYAEAEKDFKYVLDKAPSFDYRIYYNLALIEKKAEKFSEATEHLQDFLNTDPDGRIRVKAERHLESAKFLAYAYANPVPFEPKNLGPGVNTSAHEYLPAFTADGETLIFTRNERRDENFYLSKNDEKNIWQQAEALDSVNTAENEGAQTVTADGRLLIFTACNRPEGLGSCDLYFSTLNNGTYTKPRLMPEPINSRYWESQPSLTPNGDGLYFASNRPGGFGEKDIYVSYFFQGNWTKPRNLGEIINTSQDDVTPFIHADGQTLYFTSEGHPGLGGKDLFYSRWQAQERKWGKPQNLGIPINTKKDEGTLSISLDGKTAYFASDREDFAEAQGGVDLYQFELYEEAQPGQVTYVKAIVKDALTGTPLEVEAEITDLEKNRSYVKVKTDVDGSFLIVMAVGKDYGLNVEKEGYLFHSENFSLTETKDAYTPYLLEINLTPIADAVAEEGRKNEPVILKNIFFETGSADLLPSSYSELKRLKNLLEKNPSLAIQINGHTDDVGSEGDNKTLSENRAKAVFSWLTEQGIDTNRLSFKGYGESRPIADNKTKEGRRTNRRTEFVIR